MSHVVNTLLIITGASLLAAARSQAVKDGIEVVVASGPNAGTYQTPSDETICMHKKDMHFHAVTYRDLNVGAKKLSIANIQVAKSDQAGPKHGQVQVTFGTGKTPAEYQMKEAPVTMTLKGKGGVFAFEGTVKGVKIKVTGTCAAIDEM